MLKIAHINPAPADDDEAAAIATAIAICTERVASAPQDDTAGKQSGWKSAALLEATFRSGRITHPEEVRESKGWKPHAVLNVVAVLLAGTIFLSGTVCGAQELRGPILSDGMPPVAPDVVAARTAEPVQAPFQAPIQEGMRPSTTVGAPAPTLQQNRLKVALMLDTVKADVSLPDGGVVRDATTGDTLAELPAQSQWQVTTRAPGGFGQVCFAGRPGNAADMRTRVAFKPSYRPVAYTNGSLPPNVDMKPLPPNEDPKFWLPLQGSYVVIPNENEGGALALGGRLYRGVLLIKPRANSKQNGIDIINDIDLEDYLLSVVPSEMPSGWPLEALKAQAIAARSYALANRGKHGADGYDIKATIDDQAYSGVSAEHPESNRAVHETRGIVMTNNGKPVSAFFHSSSGGFTEVSENVWSRPLPYLQAVPDYDDESPHFSWTRTIDVAAAEQSLAKNGKDIGALLSLQPVARGISPRVRWLLATGTQRSVFLSGEEARKVFSLPSTNFNVGPAPDSYVFAGRGYGHGLGMSQWGAKKLAESGFAAPDILSYYYRNVTLNQI